MTTAPARKMFGSSNDRSVRARVAEIAALEGELEALSDDQLRARTDQFKKQVAEGRNDLLAPRRTGPNLDNVAARSGHRPPRRET